jgi:hypothetical protein
LHAQGRIDEAAVEYHAILEIRNRVLGNRHPDTLDSRYGLATVFYDQEKFKEAALEYSAILHLRIEILGPLHPSTLATHEGLTNALAKFELLILNR